CTPGDELGEPLLLAWEVDARHAEQRDRRERPVQTGACARLVEQPREHTETAILAQVVRRALRPPRKAEQAAVLADEREVGLRVAAVDGKDDTRSRCRQSRHLRSLGASVEPTAPAHAATPPTASP